MNKKKGYSLIELLITMSILSMLMSISIGPMITAQSNIDKTISFKESLARIIRIENNNFLNNSYFETVNNNVNSYPDNFVFTDQNNYKYGIPEYSNLVIKRLTCSDDSLGFLAKLTTNEYMDLGFQFNSCTDKKISKI